MADVETEIHDLLDALEELNIEAADEIRREVIKRIDLRRLDGRLGVLRVVDAGQFLEGIVEDPALHRSAAEVQLRIDVGSQEEDPPPPSLARSRCEPSVGLIHLSNLFLSVTAPLRFFPLCTR